MEPDEIDDTAYFKTLRAEQEGGPPSFEPTDGHAVEWVIEASARYAGPHFWRAVGVIRRVPGEGFYDYDLPEQFATEAEAVAGGHEYALDWIAQQPVE